MTLQRNQNVSFSGTVNILNLARNNKAIADIRANNPKLKPLIRHLKHHCGSKDIQHTIVLGDIQIGVCSSYKPPQKINGIDRFTKECIIVRGKPLDGENIRDLIEQSKETKEWMKDIRQRAKDEAIKKLINLHFQQDFCPKFFKKLFG